MGRLKRILIGTTGIAIGILTLRRLRKRRDDPKDQAKSAAQQAREEASKAADHSAKAVEHSAASASYVKEAGKKAIEAAEVELEGTEMDPPTKRPSPNRRMRIKRRLTRK